MEFGDKDWYEAVRKHYNFPLVFGFYIDIKKEIYSIAFDCEEGEINSISYIELEPEDNTALICVKKIKAAKEYHAEAIRIKELWK